MHISSRERRGTYGLKNYKWLCKLVQRFLPDHSCSYYLNDCRILSQQCRSRYESDRSCNTPDQGSGRQVSILYADGTVLYLYGIGKRTAIKRIL